MAAIDATQALLSTAWAALGGDEALLAGVRISGDPRGLLPSSLHALPAVVAAVATSTLAASVLEATVRGGSPAPVQVDVEHVAVCARSERYAVANGVPAAVRFAPLSRFWRTADGWLRLHANYAWHRDRALAVLDCEDRVDSVADAVGRWRGVDLEDALAAAAAVGFAVRTPADWDSHEHGKAVASLPVLRTVHGTDPGRLRHPGPPRVLDLTRVIAGPVATRTLAAWGADVLRVDSDHLPENADQAVDGLVGKASTFLDLSSGSGRATLDGLLAQADVLVAGYRPAWPGSAWPQASSSSAIRTCRWCTCPPGVPSGRGRDDAGSTRWSSAPPGSPRSKVTTSVRAPYRLRSWTMRRDTCRRPQRCSPSLARTPASPPVRRRCRSPRPRTGSGVSAAVSRRPHAIRIPPGTW